MLSNLTASSRPSSLRMTSKYNRRSLGGGRRAAGEEEQHGEQEHQEEGALLLANLGEEEGALLLSTGTHPTDIRPARRRLGLHASSRSILLQKMLWIGSGASRSRLTRLGSDCGLVRFQ